MPKRFVLHGVRTALCVSWHDTNVKSSCIIHIHTHTRTESVWKIDNCDVVRVYWLVMSNCSLWRVPHWMDPCICISAWYLSFTERNCRKRPSNWIFKASTHTHTLNGIAYKCNGCRSEMRSIENTHIRHSRKFPTWEPIFNAFNSQYSHSHKIEVKNTRLKSVLLSTKKQKQLKQEKFLSLYLFFETRTNFVRDFL